MDLTNAHVVITGASRGIGAALARDFAAAGATPTLVARNADALRALAGEVGGHAFACDLTDRDARAGVIGRAEAAGGPVDVLVNTAGIETGGLMYERSADEIEQLVVLNVLAAMELTRQALPGMVERGRGRIVLISSAAALAAFPGMAGYSATKAAMSHFAAGLRADLKGLPIGVTLVQVGFVTPTEMADRALSYPPTAAARRRFVRMGLLADTDLHKLTAAVVSAVANDRRHVLRPRRLQGFAAMSEGPRRLTELILSGVKARN
jgi:short-subunit dehydrogenase